MQQQGFLFALDTPYVQYDTTDSIYPPLVLSSSEVTVVSDERNNRGSNEEPGSQGVNAAVGSAGEPSGSQDTRELAAEEAGVSPEELDALDLELAGFAAAGLTRGARRALQPYLEDLERLGDTPFLSDPKPWIEGTRVDLIG